MTVCADKTCCLHDVLCFSCRRVQWSRSSCCCLPSCSVFTQRYQPSPRRQRLRDDTPSNHTLPQIYRTIATATNQFDLISKLPLRFILKTNGIQILRTEGGISKLFKFRSGGIFNSKLTGCCGNIICYHGKDKIIIY